MAFRRLDRYDRLDVRPWPVDPASFPLNPSHRTRGFYYCPPVKPLHALAFVAGFVVGLFSGKL